jgi:hypothetical protein
MIVAQDDARTAVQMLSTKVEMTISVADSNLKSTPQLSYSWRVRPAARATRPAYRLGDSKNARQFTQSGAFHEHLRRCAEQFRIAGKVYYVGANARRPSSITGPEGYRAYIDAAEAELPSGVSPPDGRRMLSSTTERDFPEEVRTRAFERARHRALTSLAGVE